MLQQWGRCSAAATVDLMEQVPDEAVHLVIILLFESFISFNVTAECTETSAAEEIDEGRGEETVSPKRRQTVRDESCSEANEVGYFGWFDQILRFERSLHHNTQQKEQCFDLLYQFEDEEICIVVRVCCMLAVHSLTCPG